MYEYLFFFLATFSFILLLVAILTKNFVISLFSMISNFATAYGAMAIEVPYFFYDQSNSTVVQHIYTVSSIPIAALFLLFGIASAVYAFFIPVGAVAEEEKDLRV